MFKTETRRRLPIPLRLASSPLEWRVSVAADRKLRPHPAGIVVVEYSRCWCPTFVSGSWQSAMTVVAFNNAATAQGAKAGGSAATGAPSASLATTRAGSWVCGVGTDRNAPLARTVGAAQTLVDQYFPRPAIPIGCSAKPGQQPPAAP